jgi:hypothetical protein
VKLSSQAANGTYQADVLLDWKDIQQGDDVWVVQFPEQLHLTQRCDVDAL